VANLKALWATWAGICKLFGKFWLERGLCDLPMCLQNRLGILK